MLGNFPNQFVSKIRRKQMNSVNLTVNLFSNFEKLRFLTVDSIQTTI
jgi:hypothetical protein